MKQCKFLLETGGFLCEENILLEKGAIFEEENFERK
jgi:hypothetical protein